MAAQPDSESPVRTPSRLVLRWTLTAIAYPPSGLVAITVVNRVDSPSRAALAGAIVGLGVGTAQAVALGVRLRDTAGRLRWVAATTLGSAVGLVAGASAVDFRTTLGSLAVMGAVTGAVLGSAQAVPLGRLLPTRGRSYWWPLATAVLWALGWVVTTTAGIDVERQYAVFGASGAIVSTLGAGLVLSRLSDHRGSRTPAPATRR